ncbi:hypothetical protein BH11VER1_BH11VER1_07790 [soil metagenome]
MNTNGVLHSLVFTTFKLEHAFAEPHDKQPSNH